MISPVTDLSGYGENNCLSGSIFNFGIQLSGSLNYSENGKCPNYGDASYYSQFFYDLNYPTFISASFPTGVTLSGPIETPDEDGSSFTLFNLENGCAQHQFYVTVSPEYFNIVGTGRYCESTPVDLYVTGANIISVDWEIGNVGGTMYPLPNKSTGMTITAADILALKKNINIYAPLHLHAVGTVNAKPYYDLGDPGPFTRSNFTVETNDVQLIFAATPPTPTVTATQPKCFGDVGSLHLRDFKYTDGTAYDGSVPFDMTIVGKKTGKQYPVPGFSGTSLDLEVIPDDYVIAMSAISGTGACNFEAPGATVNEVPPVIAATTTMLCNNGKPAFQIKATGGTPGYTYSVDNLNYNGNAILTGLNPATSYTYFVKDANNCLKSFTTTTEAAVVVTGAAIKAPVAGADIGRITVDAAGGTGPYTYSLDKVNWQVSNIFGGLAAGDYIVYVQDSKGCISAGYRVSLTPLDFTYTVTNTRCDQGSDGKINISISGGSMPYQIKLGASGVYRANDNQFTLLTAGNYDIYVKDADGVEAIHNVAVGSPSPVSFTTAVTNAVCKSGNGALVFTAQGGNGGYKYTVIGGPTQSTNTFSLPAGNYTLRVDDQLGCQSAQQQATVNEPAQYVGLNFQTKDVLCAGTATGMIYNLQGLNGTAPYSFSNDNLSWSTATTIGGLVAGSYTVYVKDANGCTGNNPNAMVNSPAALTIMTVGTPVNASCFGLSDGQLEVATSGGTGNITYFISSAPDVANNTGKFTGLPAGTYQVTAKDDNACEVKSAFITVGQPSAVSISGSSTPVLCNGGATGTISVSGQGGTVPLTYSIDDISYGPATSFSGLSAADYTLYLKDAHNCAASTSIKVTQPTALTISATALPVACNGGNDGQITVAAGGGVSPYQYAMDNGVFQSSATFTSTADTRLMMVKDNNGCTAQTTVAVLEPTALSLQLINKQAVSCNGYSNGSFSVVAAGATPPYSYTINQADYQTNGTFTGLTAGNYQVGVKDAHGCTFSISVTVSQPAAIGYNIINLKDIACAGDNTGAVTLTGTGGTGAYSYQFNGGSGQTNPTWNNLAANSYPLIIKDENQCTGTFTVTVKDLHAPLTATLTSNPPATCDDRGSITVASVNGGLSPYSYSLDNASFNTATVFSNLINGDYIVYVKDAEGCVINRSISPYGPVSMRGSIDASPATCYSSANGSITVSNITGGTGTYEYSIDGTSYQSSPVFNNLMGGNTYAVTVRDIPYTCQVQLTAAVGRPTALQLDLLSNRDVSCNGLSNGMITVNAAGGTSGYRYAINGGATQTTGIFDNLTAGNYHLVATDAQGCTSTLDQTVGQPSILQAAISSQADVDCFGNANGYINLTANGGTQPYTYALNGAAQNVGMFTGLAPATYQLKVTDKQGCALSLSTAISEPVRLAMTVSADPVKCFGEATGAITLNVSGGKGAYSYTLNALPAQTTNRFDHLTKGNYLLTVKDGNGCKLADNAVISQPEPLSYTRVAIDPVCSYSADGSIEVTLKGGTPPYNYSWSGNTTAPSPKISNLKGGVYFINMTDANGCQLNDNIRLTQPAAIVLNLGLKDTTLCVGQQLTLDAGNGGTDYAWTSDAGFKAGTQKVTLSKDGNYTVVVTNAAGCTATDKFALHTSLSVLQADFLMATYGTVGDTIILVDVSKPKPLALQWTMPEGAKEVGSSGDGSVQQLIFSHVGIYNIRLYTQLGQCADMITKAVTIWPEADRNNTDSALGYRPPVIKDIQLFPNPTSGNFKVSVALSESTAVTIKLINFNTGQQMDLKQSPAAMNHEVPFNITDMPQGIYLLGVQVGQEYQVKKIMKL